MNKANVFCECDKCGRDIHTGEIFYSLSLYKEIIESEVVVQPLRADSYIQWCVDCGPCNGIETTWEDSPKNQRISVNVEGFV